MTLIEKLRVAQGDNAELCRMAADAIAYLKGRSSSPCNGCKGDCDGGAICTGWDWIGNNDNVQPHTEVQKKRKRELVFEEMHISMVSSFVYAMPQSDIHSISAYCRKDGIYAVVWYWKDVETDEL